LRRTSARSFAWLALPVSCAVAVLAFEALCRIGNVDFNPNPNWRYHPVLGWSQDPGKEYDTVVDGEAVRVEFNSAGFRDRERNPLKPEGRGRILLLGDSFSEAVQVNLEDTFFHRLETRLNQAEPGRWEVINMGVGDFGTAQAWLALTEFGLAYEPDIVLVQIFPLNDICNNSIELAGLCRSQNDLYRPYLVESPEGLQLTWVSPFRHRMRRYSVTFGLLEKMGLMARDRLRGLNSDELHRRRWEAMGLPEDPLLLTYADDSHQPAPVARGWRVTEDILRLIDAELKRRSIPWVGVVIPFEARIGDRWNSLAHARRPVPFVRRYPETRLARLFQELGVPGIMMLDHFEREPEAVIPYRGGHLNPAAHHLVSEAVYDTLLEAGLLGEIRPLTSGASNVEAPPGD
jgi:hypothetical protein